MISATRLRKIGYLAVLLFIFLLLITTHLFFEDADSYSFIQEVNMSIGILCMALCIVLFFTLLFDNPPEKSTILFLWMIMATYFMLTCNFFSWYTDYNTDLEFLSSASNYLLFLMIPFSLVLYWHYLREVIGESSLLMENCERALCGLLFVDLLLIVTNPTTHLAFTLEHSHFEYSDTYPLLCVIPITMMFISAYTAYKCIYNRRSRFAMYAFTILPLSANIIEFFYEDYDTLLYVAILLALLVIYGNFYVGRSQDLAKKDAELMEQRASILVSQIQPHFLYNSLTSIMNIKGNPPETKEAIANFGRYLRYNLDILTLRSAIPLALELDHVETYVELENCSRKNRIKLDISVTNYNFHLPALTLQTIVENTFEYNFKDKKRGGVISLKSMESDSAHVIIISDDGAGVDLSELENSEDSEDFGVYGVKMRLADMGGTLKFESISGIGTTYTVTIPKTTSL